jgi:hypothetical protein
MTDTPLKSLSEIMKEYPYLNMYGLNMFRLSLGTIEQQRAEFIRDRQELATREDFILTITDWLIQNITKIKTPTVNSYYMKHVVENAMDNYTANGELIAAALIGGYPIRQIDESPNAIIGFSLKDVKKFPRRG